MKILLLPKRPMAAIALLFAAGIVAGKQNIFAIKYWGLLCVVLMMLAYVSRKSKVTSTVLILLVYFCCGGAYVTSSTTLHKKHVSHVAKYYRGKNLAIKGRVCSSISLRDSLGGKKTSFDLEVEQINTQWGWKKKKGKILVNVFKAWDVAYGDYVFLQGKLHRPFNFSKGKNFSYRDYLENKSICLILSVKSDADIAVIKKKNMKSPKAFSLTVRNRLKDRFHHYLTKNESGIMQAILLGDRTGIPKDIRELFVRTGTAHILAISGLHVGIIAALFIVFVRMIPIARKAQLMIVIILLIFYATITGGRASVIRAVIMTVVFLASYVLERETETINTLFLAAFLILLVNPLNLFDVGFQLSFTCVLSIILFNAKINFGLSKMIIDQEDKGKVKSYFVNSLSISIAVWVGVAGLIVYYFNIVTPITIFANLIVVPLITVVVALGFLLLISANITPLLCLWIAACIKIFLNAMVGIIFVLDKAPFSHFVIRNVSFWHIMVYYGVVFAIIVICNLVLTKSSD